MKILIFTQYFWPEDFRINDLALGMQERGHHVTVLTGIPNYPQGKFYSGYGFFRQTRQDYNGVKVFRVPLFPRGIGKGWRLALNYLSFALFASFLAPLYCRDKFDIIFVCQYSPVTVGIPSILFKKLREIPIIFWIQDLWPESLSATGAVKSERVLAMVRRLVRFIYRNCDRILVQSMGFYRYVVKESVKKEKLGYFPNWAEELYKPVPPDKKSPEQIKFPLGFRVMFAGNIGAAQDFGTILLAAEKLRDYPNIQWLVLGDGRMRGWVEEQVQRRGLKSNFHLLGRHPVETMPIYFSLADAMLVTLKREQVFSLTIPSKIQSYLACGRPILAALDGEGARVVEEAGAGFTCPAEDWEALAEIVLKMYQTSISERRSMGLMGRAYYESHFEREMLLECLEAWMEEMTKIGNKNDQLT